MVRCWVSFIVLYVSSRACAAGLGATQAGEPMAVNVDYDVPVYGARDAAMRVQRGVDLEAKLRATSSLRAVSGLSRRSDLPFSAFSTRAGERDATSQGTVVTVHVPSPVGAAATLLADARADATVLEQLAKAQDLQEQRFLGEVRTVTLASRSAGVP